MSFEGYVENKAKVNFSLFAGKYVNEEIQGSKLLTLCIF
jgi:hypothetical protein